MLSPMEGMLTTRGQNFLIDPSGHIKLTDFGLAAGALNPGKIENMKYKVGPLSPRLELRTDEQRVKLDEVKDCEIIYRTTIEMKSLYKSIRMAEPRYVRSPSSPVVATNAMTPGQLDRRFARLHGDRDPARSVLLVLRRLLVPRLHPLRVPRRLSAVQWRDGGGDVEQLEELEQVFEEAAL
jgi:serine/threonine protein kinase